MNSRQKKLDEFVQAKAHEVNRLRDVLGITFVKMAEGGTIDEVTAAEHSDFFNGWEPSISYSVGDIRRFEDNLYRCLQAHTSQNGWEPDVASALWKKIGDPTDEWPEWSQPIGAGDEYSVGDKVSHKDKHWTSTIDRNVWEPGVYGWTEVSDA